MTDTSGETLPTKCMRPFIHNFHWPLRCTVLNKEGHGEMSERQDLVAFCHMFTPEIFEIIRMRVYAAKL